MAIAPHASKLVWYDFREKLPQVSPPAPRKSSLPPRAEVKIASQEIVAGSAKSPHARQFIWQPAPKLELKTELQSPNVLAIHKPPPPATPPKSKVFVPPPESPKPAPEAPKPAPPPEIRTARALDRAGNPLGMQPVKAPPRAFVTPKSGRPIEKPAAALPEAPALAAEKLNAAGAPALVNSSAPAPRRPMVAPTGNAKPGTPAASLPDAPALPETGPPAAVSVAIVGLNPAAGAPAPVPEGSRDAQFSAGPKERANGGLDGSADGAMLTVPGLLVRNSNPDAKPAIIARAAAPTSAGNLRSALRSSLPAAAPSGTQSAAIRVSSAPDSPLNGRITYAMSIQMPNTTSYTGSWMIWFAERGQESRSGSALTPPTPLRKVDPKYYAAAVADRVEGTVRLTAVIRKDGQVESVTLLQHLDDRLDHSAAEALDKWRFEPAQRDGVPVDIDAVIEIPFRLAPKTVK